MDRFGRTPVCQGCRHLYERLNRLTRADATTQNKRKAMIFSQAMDEMEERVRELKKKEDFDAIRPDLDGNEIMELLGLEPGPMIGRAYKHMRNTAWITVRWTTMWPSKNSSAGTPRFSSPILVRYQKTVR